MAKGNVCYYCGTKLTRGKNGNKSAEHIPPKMLFQGFKCDSITVPSCPIHNLSKSNQDQTLISGLLQTLDAGNYILHPDVMFAIQHETGKSTFGLTKNKAKTRPFFKNPTGDLANLPPVSQIDYPTNDWIKQITAGLVFDATQKYDSAINWDTAVIHSTAWYIGDPNGFEEQEGIELIHKAYEIAESWEDKNWLDGWSSQPKPYPPTIYRFYVAFGFDKPVSVCFKHVFYNSLTWYIEFQCSEVTRQPLGHKVLQTNGL
jgi:hypothetical protein